MKLKLHQLLFLFLGLWGYFIPSKTQAQGVPELIYYKFDAAGSTVQNFASNPVGTGPGTVNGATIGGTGQFGMALLGNGGSIASNSVNANWAMNLSGPWTMSMWISGVTNNLTNNYLFGGSGGSNFRAFTGSAVASGAGNLLIRGNSMTDVLLNNIFDANGSPVVIHLVYDPAASNIKAYVNGALNTTVNQTTTMALTGSAFTIGGQSSGGGLPAGGKIDEFRLYSRALSATEINTTWNVMLPYTPSPNDAGVTTLNAPVNPATPGSQPIQVIIKNHGTSALTSAQIGWKVGSTNGTPFAWTGSLAPGASSTPITIGTHNFTAGTHAVKIWTGMPNNQTDGNHYNDTLSTSIIACNTLSGTYTINKGAPASATNFISFAAALQVLNNCGVSGPVTFNVVNGSGPYNEQVTFNTINGTSATNTVTFNGNGNTITSSIAASTEAVMKLDGADYLRINNFTIASDSTNTVGNVILLTARADNNIFSNNNLRHSRNTTSSTSYVVHLNTGSSNNAFQNNTLTGAYYGIYNYGASTTPVNYNTFKNNTLNDQYYYGIYNLYSTGTLIEGNDISRPTRTNGNYMYGIYNTTATTEYTITKNRIHNTNDMTSSATGTIYGIYSGAAGTVGSESIISNNLIYNINNNGGTLYGFYNLGGNNIYYYHNTVSADLPNISYSTVRGMYFSSASTNVKFINNVMSLTGSATNTHAIYLGSSTISLISNNNTLFVGTSGNIGYYLGNKATMTDWLAANSGAYDQNSVSADPQFLNLPIGNLKPTNFTLNNIGQPVAAVTTDITGATRSTTTPDPGAYEFTPSPNDAGITAIVAPTSPVNPAPNIPVQVTIKNFGTANLASATINWTVNGVAQTPHSWTGNLGTQATANVTIGTYSFTTGNYTIEACTSMPNGATDSNPGSDCFSTQLIACTALAGNYTINQNLPASATNFTSLTDAANRINNCGVSGAVTFTVAPNSGPYNEQLILGPISGVSATNTVTFEGSGNTVSATPGLTALGVVTLNGATYVKVNNFTLTLDAAATTGWGVQFMNTADHNTISNNTINLPISATTTNFLGIGTGITYTTYGDHTNNSKIQNNIINGGYYGIRINGTSTTVFSTGNEITGNQIKDAYYYGIYLYYSSNMLIEGNDISRMGRNDGTIYNAMYHYYSPSITFSKNRIHGIGGNSVYGIYSSSSDAPVGSENIFSNNLIYNLTNTGTTYPIYSIGTDNTFYLHNTIDLNNTSNTGTVRGFYQTTTATNVKFQNNIISITGGTGTYTGLYFATAASVINSNNNVIYVPTGDVGYYGSAFTTLANWKTANSNAYDQNSVSADPVFVSPSTGNYKPSSVLVGDIGQPGTGITDDITGILRSTTTPDPGAYEFGVMPNDVGITAVSGPVSGCGLTANETITVTIKNYGSNPQTSIPVSYSVNNGTPVSQTWTGTLAPNATAVLAFTQTADMSVAGSYIIIASTQLSGDANASNDADTLTVTNSLMPAGPVSIGFELPASGLNAMNVVTNANSNITESTAAATGTGSTKGMIMDGVDNAAWVVPSAANSPWTINPDNFSAVYMCFTPQAGQANDTLFLEFDLKQLYKTTHFNTNFRVTVNGQQVGTTYNPPFGGYGTGVAPWTHVKLNISSFLNSPTIEIGLESSVKEEYDNGNGTANLIDNIMAQRVAGPTTGTGVKENFLQSNVVVFPNPSNGIFNLKVPAATRSYSVEVTDLTGKVVKQQLVKNNSGAEQLNLNGAAKGIYILKITSEGNVATRKLIVE